MDVAKYIGLFLLKNNFVYIHGLGNLELRKKPAVYEGDALVAPRYEVLLTPSGSIDDNLANFIANNEQTSISKASNALRDFSIQAREELHSGKDVEIPSIGKFIEVNGKISFVTSPGFSFSPPSIPTVKMAPQRETTPFAPVYNTVAPKPANPSPPGYESKMPEHGSGTPINWMRVAAVGLGFIILIVVIYFGVQYMTDSNSTKEAPLIPAQVQDENLPPVSEDTTSMDTVAAPPVAGPTGTVTYDVQVGNPYTDLDAISKYVKKLQNWGHKVEMAAEEDSSAYYVVLPVRNYPVADTAVLMDSLRTQYRNIKVLP